MNSQNTNLVNSSNEPNINRDFSGPTQTNQPSIVREWISQGSNTSVFTKCSFYEQIDTKLLNRLIQSPLSSSKTYRELGWDDDEELHIADLCEKTHLTNILSKIKDGELKTTYNFSSRTNIGRVYVKSSNGFVALRRHIRHIIAGECYIDIDIENAHPTMISQLFEKECKLLVIPQYVANRNSFFEKISTYFNLTEYIDTETNTITTIKDQCKKYMSALFFGAGLKKLHKTVGYQGDDENAHPDFVKQMKNEINRVYDKTIELNPWLYNFKNTKKGKREKNALFALYMQEYERRVLECVFMHLCDIGVWKLTGRNNGSLCYDGLMVLKNVIDRHPTLLQDFQNKIKRELGFNLKWTIKPMDVPSESLDLLNTISQSENTIKTTLPDDFIVPDGTDKVFADIIVSRCRNRIMYQDGNWYELHPDTNIWKVQESIINLIMNELLLHVKQYTDWKLQTDNDSVTKKTLSMMKLRVGSTSGATAVEKTLRKLLTPDSHIEFDGVRPEILAFPDGTCYDLLNKEFRKLVPTDYVSTTCKVSLNQDEYNRFTEYSIENGETIWTDEIYRKLMKNLWDTFSAYNKDDSDPSNKSRVFYCYKRLSRCLFGRNTDETYDEYVGRGGNGKSNISTLFISSLGDYVNVISAEQFTKPIRDSTTANSGMVSCIGKRLVICSEPQEYDRIQSATMKRWTGNDELVARGLFQNERKFRPTFKVIIQSNHTLTFDSTDMGVRRRRRIIRFDKSFIPKSDYDKKQKDDTLKLWERVGDSSLKSQFENENYAKRFIAFLIHSYNSPDVNIPVEFEDEVEEAMEQDNPISWFMNDYCVPERDETMMISGTSLYETYKDYCSTLKKRQVSQTTFGTKVKNLFAFRKTGGIRYYIGISVKPIGRETNDK
jgi:phage/plasmid-associated DNA primase